MKTTTVNGIELAYRIDGEKSKPWIILSNSLATDYRMWDPQIPTLTLSHCVLRYDTRGHGQSQASAGDYSLELLISDAVGLMNELGIAKADVMGLSLGGMTALGLAIHHADRVDRLICCDARADAPLPYVNFWQERISIARQKGLAAIVSGTLERWFTEEFRAEPQKSTSLALATDMMLSTSVDGFCGCAAALTRLNLTPLLGSISSPTLCLAGDQDQAAPPNTMRDIANAIRLGSFTVLTDAAHLSNLNQPTAFNRAIGSWLADGNSQTDCVS